MSPESTDAEIAGEIMDYILRDGDLCRWRRYHLCIHVDLRPNPAWSGKTLKDAWTVRAPATLIARKIDPGVTYHWKHKNRFGVTFPAGSAGRAAAHAWGVAALLAGYTVFGMLRKEWSGAGSSIAIEREHMTKHDRHRFNPTDAMVA